MIETTSDLKLCSVCQEPKSVYLFHLNRRTKDGLDARCKKCHLLRSRRYACCKKCGGVRSAQGGALCARCYYRRKNVPAPLCAGLPLKKWSEHWDRNATKGFGDVLRHLLTENRDSYWTDYQTRLDAPILENGQTLHDVISDRSLNPEQALLMKEEAVDQHST